MDKWRTPAIELFLLSFVSLFVELLVIRWMSCDFRSMAIFKTFPLVACFVGLGVGFSLERDRFFRWSPLLMLLMVVPIRVSDFFGLTTFPYPTTSIYQWGEITRFDLAMWVYIFAYMGWFALVLAAPFALMIAIGSRLGVLFNQHKPLTAYCINIGGAILGSIIFVVLSFLCWPPWALLLLPAIVFVYYIPQPIRSVVPLALAVGLALVPMVSDEGTIWSPYFRVNVKPIASTTDLSGQPYGFLVNVNQMFQQYFFPRQPPERDLSADVAKIVRVRQQYYSLPYLFKQQPEDVLILGCGLGQDVLQAVREGAKSIDAVEIDPEILKLGRKYNPAYSALRVHLICNDARNFINRCQKRYDLIAVACLDSLAVTGLGSSVRIDSYVHTQESLTKLLGLLKPDGVLVMSFGAGGGSWLRDRLFCTLREAAGYEPLYLTDEKQEEKWPAFVYVAGPPVRNGTIEIHGQTNYLKEPLQDVECPRILTDDYPYLYIAPKGIDVPYLLLLLEIVALALLSGRRLLFNQVEPGYWQMFFLGAAFMLLELQSISRLSLLYGATWLTSSIVINGVLIMILAANCIVLKSPRVMSANFSLIYGFLMANIALNYLLPMNDILQKTANLAYVAHGAITVLTLTPLFLAGIIFATGFVQLKDSARGMAFNLFGAVAGAMLELLSGYTGVNFLLLIAVGLYLASYVFAARQFKLSWVP